MFHIKYKNPALLVSIKSHFHSIIYTKRPYNLTFKQIKWLSKFLTLYYKLCLLLWNNFTVGRNNKLYLKKTPRAADNVIYWYYLF